MSSSDSRTDEGSRDGAAVNRRFEVIAAGFSGDDDAARDALDDVEPSVIASALRALARLNELTDQDLNTRITHSSAEVRRTVAELARSFPDVPVRILVDDPDVFVAEMAAWCLGERTSPSDADVEILVDRTTSHREPLVREACAAALGAIGDPRGLPAILAACNDKPAVRRRAVLALAPFEGEEVEAMLAKALEDSDWQVRQNAEDLLKPRS